MSISALSRGLATPSFLTPVEVTQLFRSNKNSFSLPSTIPSFLDKLIGEIILSSKGSILALINESNTKDLQQTIQMAAKGATVSVSPGSYGQIFIDKDISLVGRDKNNPPNILKINATNASVITLQNLNVGTPGLSAEVIQRLLLSDSGIRSLTNKPSKITINNVK